MQKEVQALRVELSKENNAAKFEAQKKEFLSAVTKKMQQLDDKVQDFTHKTQERITRSLLEDGHPSDSILSASSSSPLEQPFLDKLHSTPKPAPVRANPHIVDNFASSSSSLPEMPEMHEMQPQMPASPSMPIQQRREGPPKPHLDQSESLRRMEPTDSDFFNLTEDPSGVMPEPLFGRNELSSNGALSIQRVVNDDLKDV